MLTHEKIRLAVAKKAKGYPIKKVFYFGSYAEKEATRKSDLDLLVEFNKTISLLTLIGLKQDLEDELNISVDVIPYPVPKDSILEIDKMVNIYG